MKALEAHLTIDQAEKRNPAMYRPRWTRHKLPCIISIMIAENFPRNYRFVFHWICGVVVCAQEFHPADPGSNLGTFLADFFSRPQQSFSSAPVYFRVSNDLPIARWRWLDPPLPPLPPLTSRVVFILEAPPRLIKQRSLAGVLTPWIPSSCHSFSYPHPGQGLAHSDLKQSSGGLGWGGD